MPLTSSQISSIKFILSPDEIIDKSSPSYATESKVWSFQKNQHPELVVRPKTLASLQGVLVYLSDLDLDFAVRSGGVGSSSGKDVVLSMTAFSELEWDSDSETVIVGAGQTWGDVDLKMEEKAPGFLVVGARCPFLGVAGSILNGGISWLSHEYGLSSDPQNMLDAQVVLLDGRVLWASEEPDLLWALRGGGGSFGVVTSFKMKAHRYSPSVYAGIIAFPYSSLAAVSKGVSDYANRKGDPKSAMHIFILDQQGRALKGLPSEADLSFLVFDANGEEHGRSEEGFKWALDIDGAVDMTKGGMSIREVNNLQAGTVELMGMISGNLSAALVDEIDPEFVVRAGEWFKNIVKIDNNLGAGSFALLEIMQKGAFNYSGAPSETAWPHDSQKHILQFATGTIPGASPSNEIVLELLEKAPSEVAKSHDSGDYLPAFIENFHDPKKIFGVNYHRLQELKARYDPRGRLNKDFLNQ